MQLITPEISWHQKEPIYSIDLCPKSWKLASAGADSTVKIWLVKEKEDGDIKLEFLANLDRHSKPVNVVRFSPDGNLLASGSDDGAIILWKLNENGNRSSENFMDDDSMMSKENWVVHKMLRGHIDDVYDLAWSPDSTQLLSGSVDNSAIIWDAAKGQSKRILTDHKHYVQGVCWDPRNCYVATHSSDRACRLYSTANHKCLYNINKNVMSYEKDGEVTKSKYSRMFMDENMQSFFRRCTFTTDGSFLLLPAGLCDGENKPRKTTYVFARGHYKRPIQHLPGSKKATVAVKCSPIVYELIGDTENKENQSFGSQGTEYLKVPYRMVFAVASLDSVTIYDTQHDVPLGHVANMHYASLTDMAWSSDGKLLVISSTDGYCSFIKFDQGELGDPILFDPIQYQITQAKIRKQSKKETMKKEEKKVDTDPLEETKIEENTEKVVIPIITVEEQKEKAPVKTADRKQPTIDKLFVTPVRKRKRVAEGSPVNTSEKVTVGSPKIEANDSTPVSSPYAELSQKTAIDVKERNLIQDSPLSSKKQIPQKAPKRVQVITLSTTEEKSPVPQKQCPVGEVATLSTKSPSFHCTNPPVISLLSPTKLKHINVRNQSPNRKSPGASLMSPIKPPKRVSVTTLVTFPTSSNSEESQSLPITPLKSNCIASMLTSPSLDGREREKTPKGNFPKPPKRISVQTLSTFTDIQNNKASKSLVEKVTPLATVVKSAELNDAVTSTSFDLPLTESIEPVNTAVFDSFQNAEKLLNQSTSSFSPQTESAMNTLPKKTNTEEPIVID